MTVRTRTNTSPSVTGTSTYSNHPASNSTQVADGSKETIVDVVAPGDGHDLTITRRQRLDQNYLMNGSYWRSSIYGLRTLENFSMTRFRDIDNAHFGPLGITGRPADGQLASRLLAMTNPSRPNVDIPVFIGELGDLPKSVFWGGKTLLGKGASGNLAVQFGIMPLVSDLTSLLNFTALAAKRFEELEALKRTGLRRTRTLWRGSNRTFTTGLAFHTAANLLIYGSNIAETLVHIKGHVKWFPTGNFPTTDEAMLRAARRAVGGLTLDPSTAWELIPFSWLFDWYGNVGTYLKATRNIVPCLPTAPQIMEHTETRHIATVTSCAKPVVMPVGQKIKTLTETKTRRTSPASLSASMPALSLGQLSILGSLAITRSGRY